MASPPHAAVTPAGIRDGDPAALAPLVERRANAVLSYCEAVCPPPAAERAAAEAFARFRAAVAAAVEPRALDPEALLLGATRHAAASLTVISEAPSPSCALVPGLLAARADDALDDAAAERLAPHLAAHAACRELAAAVDRAERVYASPPPRTVPIGALAVIMLALSAAAPVTAESEERLAAGVVVGDPERATPVAAPGRVKGGVAHPRPVRRHPRRPAPSDPGVFLRYVLPTASVAVALLAAMSVAGVFTTDEPVRTSAAERRVAPAAPPAPPAARDAVPARSVASERRERAAAAARRRARRAAAAAP